jgi:hypothetical protein
LSEKSTGFLSTCGITLFPSVKLRDEFLVLASKVLGVQLPDKITKFVLDRRTSVKALPVVDHHKAFISKTPDWRRPSIRVRHSRNPTTDLKV